MKEKSTSSFSLVVEETANRCPAGEKYASQNAAKGKIPVFSCEGACIRGEIARLAANLVGKEEGYARCCHAETFTVPGSAMAEWVKKAEKVVIIDGCFLKCHGRILKSLVSEDKIVYFDALSHYKKYSDLFNVDDVPEKERKAVARKVAEWVIESLKEG